MAEQIVPGPSLTAVASPVDRFVAPVQKEVGEDPMIALARTLSKVNPNIQGFLQGRHEDYVAEETAEGEKAASYIDPSISLRQNRAGWQELIAQQRKADQANGTSYADRLAASSPHFRRGLVKSRAQRLGMALNDHLSSLYSRNPQVEIGGQMVNLHSVDDPTALSAWVQQETNSYAERYGIDEMDPVLASEVFNPMAARAWSNLSNTHSKLRLERYQQEYSDEMSSTAGMILHGATPVGEGYDEAGMDAAATTAMEALEEAVGHPLKVNSAYRSPEHNRRVGGAKHSQHTHGKAFDVDVSGMSIPERQELIRKARAAGFSGIGVYKNSLHFDVGGERNWGPDYKSGSTPEWAKEALATPTGELGIPAERLQTAHLQALLDNSAAEGLDPKVANNNVVEAVITAAFEAQNPAVLSVLDDLTTGSGSLGKIGWVKSKVAAARRSITSAINTAEREQRVREEWERADAKRAIMTEGIAALLTDPTADVTPYAGAALDSGNPELATQITAFKETMLDRGNKVRTDFKTFNQLRYHIGSSTDDAALDKLMVEVVTAGNAELIDHSAVGQLMDDIAQQRRNASVMRNPYVEDYRDKLGRIIRDRFSQGQGMFKEGGYEQEYTAVGMFDVMIRSALTENPEMGEAQLMQLASQTANQIMSMTDMQGGGGFTMGDTPAPASETPNPNDNASLASDPVALVAAAEAAGLTVAEFVEKNRLFEQER